MDKKYMKKPHWNMHGDRRPDSSATKAFDLLRTAFFTSDESPQPSTNFGGEPEDDETKEDLQFRSQLRDAEMPLYSTSAKYTKVSATMALYRIKVNSGMSENYFDQLLQVMSENNIDVYLAPLVDDLRDLWNEGIEVYDSFQKQNFILRAMLMWTVSDYPALGTLSGCKVKGKQACNLCGKDTPCRWLKFSRKYVYLGNRKRFRPGHPYRRRKQWFDNTIEEGSAKRIQTGSEIFEILKEFKNDFGRPLQNESKRKRNEVLEDGECPEEELDESNDKWQWKKRSIFFDLPYWKDLPVRHNIDVMHVEKNLTTSVKWSGTSRLWRECVKWSGTFLRHFLILCFTFLYI